MNFNQRNPRNLSFIKRFGCAFCSSLYQIYRLIPELQKIDLDLNDWYIIFKKHKVFNNEGLLIWGNLEKLFTQIKVTPLLWDGTHRKISDITNRSVISVDYNPKTPKRETHFVSVKEIMLTNIAVYDSFWNEFSLITTRYNKGSIKESVYSIIQFERKM